MEVSIHQNFYCTDWQIFYFMHILSSICAVLSLSFCTLELQLASYWLHLLVYMWPPAQPAKKCHSNWRCQLFIEETNALARKA
uniref:Uncharacterized protein n=1 Tax=Pyxicephalus adspersus TaxID=30357 RepID=A0AAV2ZUV7_PYXAD|nr:TPA: hypothetical protein GDO54_016299 [Pyxicephalus adspersus]